MKRSLLFVALATLVAFPALACAQQMAGARGAASLALDPGTVAVEYGRPELKGRDPSTMMKPGMEWRLGSNAATTLTTDVPLRFGQTVVPAGSYVLKARMSADRQWHLLVDPKGGGARVAEVPLTMSTVADSAEQLTIGLERADRGGKIMVHWGTLSLATGFEKGA